jgi:DNA-binding MarR family transcriptional regulator
MDLLEVRKLNTAIEAELNRQLNHLDLTYVQGSLLGLLVKVGADDTSQRQIETWLGLSRPTVAGILQRLNEKGLVDVEPNAADRRRHRVLITDEGRRRANAVSEIIGELTTRVFAGFSQAEVAQLSEFFARATSNLGAVAAGRRSAETTLAK